MPTPEELQRQQDSLAALLGNQSQSGLYGRTADLLAEDTDAYGNFDPRGGQAYTAATEMDAQDDPWAEHYRDVGEAQSQEELYARPGQKQQRDDALARILAPIQERGRFEVEQQRIQAGGQMGAAQAAAQGRQATQDASMARNRASQAGRLQTQRNTQLENQAKEAQKTGRSSMNPMSWLFGQPTGEEQAATFRGQQQFGQPGIESEMGGGDQYEQVKAALAALGYDPETANIEGILSDPTAMAELGF